MERLESKQRECIDIIEDEPVKKKNNKKTKNDCGLSNLKRNELLQELAQLHLRKTEILKDCIKKNASRGVLLPNIKVTFVFNKILQFRKINVYPLPKNFLRLKN